MWEVAETEMKKAKKQGKKYAVTKGKQSMKFQCW